MPTNSMLIDSPFASTDAEVRTIGVKASAGTRSTAAINAMSPAVSSARKSAALTSAPTE